MHVCAQTPQNTLSLHQPSSAPHWQGYCAPVLTPSGAPSASSGSRRPLGFFSCWCVFYLPCSAYPASEVNNVKTGTKMDDSCWVTPDCGGRLSERYTRRIFSPLRTAAERRSYVEDPRAKDSARSDLAVDVLTLVVQPLRVEDLSRQKQIYANTGHYFLGYFSPIESSNDLLSLTRACDDFALPPC